VIGLLKRLFGRGAERGAEIPDPLWSDVTSALPFLADLSADEHAKLRSLTAAFLAQKEMHGADGLELTDEMRLAIAVQACLPILELGLGVYRGWVGIIVYAGEFRVQRERVDADGVLHQWDDELSGESWTGGPVVLSWADAGTAEVGYNVVIHEFAHKLDDLDGLVDGVPPCPPRWQDEAWHVLWERHFDQFIEMVEREEIMPFDPYGAEAPEEFFAVMSEEFFTAPADLHEYFPELYTGLVAFYRQDPLARSQRPAAPAA